LEVARHLGRIHWEGDTLMIDVQTGQLFSGGVVADNTSTRPQAECVMKPEDRVNDSFGPTGQYQ
jgi:hypothetical protein